VTDTNVCAFCGREQRLHLGGPVPALMYGISAGTPAFNQPGALFTGEVRLFDGHACCFLCFRTVLRRGCVCDTGMKPGCPYHAARFSFVVDPYQRAEDKVAWQDLVIPSAVKLRPLPHVSDTSVSPGRCLRCKQTHGKVEQFGAFHRPYHLECLKEELAEQDAKEEVEQRKEQTRVAGEAEKTASQARWARERVLVGAVSAAAIVGSLVKIALYFVGY